MPRKSKHQRERARAEKAAREAQSPTLAVTELEVQRQPIAEHTQFVQKTAAQSITESDVQDLIDEISRSQTSIVDDTALERKAEAPAKEDNLRGRSEGEVQRQFEIISDSDMSDIDENSSERAENERWRKKIAGGRKMIRFLNDSCKYLRLCDMTL